MNRPASTENGGAADARPGPLSERIAGRIRALILDGELHPGARIGQEAIAERFGTSRIPVREALRQLENEGLVILVPNSSARVAVLDVRELSEIYKIRELIEPLALGESIPRMSDEDVSALDAAVSEIEVTEDVDVFLRLDREFHLSSYQRADMPELLGLVERYWNTTQHYRRAYTRMVWQKGNWIINSEHRLLMEAIRRRDPVDAGQILKMHVRRTRQELTRHQELFDTPPASRSRQPGH